MTGESRGLCRVIYDRMVSENPQAKADINTTLIYELCEKQGWCDKYTRQRLDLFRAAIVKIDTHKALTYRNVAIVNKPE